MYRCEITIRLIEPLAEACTPEITWPSSVVSLIGKYDEKILIQTDGGKTDVCAELSRDIIMGIKINLDCTLKQIAQVLN